MSTIGTSLNLASLTHTRKMMKNKDGQEIECLVIPIELNKLHKGEKGLYLNLIGFQYKDPKEKVTHIVKQSFSKDFLASLTEDQRKALPILGSHSVYDGISSESELAAVQSEDDDLPF